MVISESIAWVVCSLVLIQTVVLCQKTVLDKLNQKGLCSSEPVEPRNFIDLKKTTTIQCDEHIREVYKDLFVMATHDDVCTIGKAQQIVNYLERHIKPYVTTKVNGAKELSFFAIAYGMMVSERCDYIWWMISLPRVTQS